MMVGKDIFPFRESLHDLQEWTSGGSCHDETCGS
jgi:hypothetical protein